MTPVLSSRALVVQLQNSSASMIDGEEVRVIFQLLRLADPYTSSVWHSIWHGSGLTP